ncbi:MAG: acyl-CoA/acyl-ACP dehydrogenase [Proteobacteria bacterium]|nr:acyl-CoA/acyl-ACP dehydrogenase [Pseudomonadota bacterium]
MEFTFSEDQQLLQQTVREFLAGECPVERVRSEWDSETGRSAELWGQLTEIGLPGLLIAEDQGGLGLDEIDAVLLLEECGRAALAEPLVGAFVGTRVLQQAPDSTLSDTWLPRVAAGEARLAVGHSVSPLVSDAHVADLLLLPASEELHAVPADRVALTAQPANDPARRLFTVAWEPGPDTRLAAGADALALRASAFDRGAFASAAQALGVGDRLIELAVGYANQRHQFGVPIGSFQAVKHQLADVKVALEYARSLVYRAAHSVARDAATRASDVSMAKLAACEAAARAARVSLQVHGAIGYTWEQDLHVFMRRAWSLELAWGDPAWHRERLASGVIDGETPTQSFGYTAPAA